MVGEMTSGRRQSGGVRMDNMKTAVTGGRKAMATHNVRSVTSGRRQRWSATSGRWRRECNCRMETMTTARRSRLDSDDNGWKATSKWWQRQQERQRWGGDSNSSNVTTGRWRRRQQDCHDRTMMTATAGLSLQDSDDNDSSTQDGDDDGSRRQDGDGNSSRNATSGWQKSGRDFVSTRQSTGHWTQFLQCQMEY